MASKTRVLLEISLLVLLTLLDARDFWFKTQWLGASDSFAFSTTETMELALEKLVINENVDARTAGWSSFLQSCESMQAFRGTSFLHTLHTNCDIGGGSKSLPVQLIVTGDVRADSMAWAACSLMYSYRRPPICREDVVTDFLRRYRLPAPRVTREMMAEPKSSAELELLRLLDLISTSMPLSKVVCVEGFELNPDINSPQKAQIFGCASPNEDWSAFVGLHARSFRDLHADKAWLTLDDATLLGMHFTVRQNAVSSFSVVSHGTGGNQAMTLVHTTRMNLSCFGFLFHLMVVLDLTLLLLHTMGALQVAQMVILRRRGEDKSVLSRQTLLMSSLYRSQSIALLTVATQLMAWMLTLPNAVVWSWGSPSSLESWHVCLTMLRVWSLVLIMFQNMWDALVSLNETQAYLWTKFTYISSTELAAIVSTVLYFMRGQLVSVVAQKHLLDKQRIVDSTSFEHLNALSNAYGEEQDAQLSSQTVGGTVRLIYGPLSELVFWSMLLIAVVLTLRYSFNYVLAKKSPQQIAPTATGGKSGVYARLPIEELLDNPIRAKSIVRSSLGGVEKHKDSDIALYISQLLEHGIVLEKNRILRTRQGFFGVIPASVRTDGPLVNDCEFAGNYGNEIDLQQPPPSPDGKRRRSLRW